MDVLKELLEASNISYSEGIFESDTGLSTVKHMIVSPHNCKS